MRPMTVNWVNLWYGLLCLLSVCSLAVATTNCQWIQSANTYADNGQLVNLAITTVQDCQNQCKDNCVAVMYELPYCYLFSDTPQAVTDPQSYSWVLYKKTCTTGLQPSDGQYSELKNIARGKTVFSSSQAGPTFKPELAIDGPAGGCFTAANTDSEPYWGIDLGKVQEVKEIHITNRADCCADELNNFAIELFVSDPLKGNSGTPCITVTTAIGLGATGKYQCASAAQSPSGRWLRIKKTAPKLTLCEVGIVVAVPQTGVASINCTFEEEDLYTDCNLYNAPSSDFQFAKGTHGSGPPSDHTTENGAKNGKYMYADLTEVQVGKKAALMSFEITSQYDCVTFWYYLTATEATKNVLVVQEAETSSLASPVTLWSSDGQDLTLWRRAQIQARGGSRRIIFVVEKIRGGFVAIDDLTISSEACPSRARIYDAINCSFEDPSGNICDFGHPTTDGRDWVWTNTPTPTANTGPPPPTGYYMYSRGDSATAALVTPKLRATFPKSCLRFRLHRYKQGSESNLGNLYVKVLTNIDGNLQSTPAQWSTATQQLANKNEWVPVEVTINTPPNSVIAFERKGGEADIAIDDVSLVNSECQKMTAFSCLFSSTICSYFAQYFSNSVPWELRTSPPSSQLVGPSTGHTGDRYAFPAFKGPGDATEASLVTAPIEMDVSQSCLTFWYAMGTDSELGTFEVRVSDPDLSNPRAVWSFSRGMSDELINHWTRAAVTLNTENPIRITFWVNDTYGNTTVGLDDAELNRAPCPSEKDVSTFSCNLDTDDICGLGQISLGDHFDWTWYTGSTPTEHTGPDKDHTSGNGHYLYIEVSEPRQQSDKAILYTPTIVPTSPKSCLTLYFHMHGNHTGSLAVFKDKSTFSSTSQRLWVQRGDQGKAWKKASIEMDTLEPYKLFFEGSVGQGALGDIAIDDIKVQDKDCQAYSAFSCSFEITLCGFLQWHRDDFQWTHKRIERRSSGTGPSFSPHVAGSFMQVEVDGSRSPGDTAVLVSPLMTTLSTNDSCLTFWYHLHGQAVGELTLLTSDPGVKDNTTVWSADSETGDRWNRVAVTIQTSPPSRFLFMATVGKGRGDIAIDEVDINIGACPHDRLVDRFRCDFDKSEVCGFRNEHGTADNFDWLWHTGKTPTGSSPGVETGPNKDHTSGSGHYMYIDASSPRAEGNTARLVSPFIWFFTAQGCLSFWYSMSGSQVGRLRVSILTSEGLTIPVWTRTGHQGTGWIQATVELQKRAVKFQFVFEGTVGPGPAGNIAIDDLELTNDPCPAVVTESVNCTFSGGDMCGYKQSKRDGLVWTLTKGNFTSGTPSGDNTTGDGQFMYQKNYRPKTALVSPVLSWDVRENCLQFDYSMVGRTMGTLIVSLARAGMLEERQPLLSTDNETSKQWVRASFDFEIHHPLQIIFEVVRGSGLYTDIAIDNVKVLPHKCSETAATCSFTSDLCQYTIISTASSSPPGWLRHRGETPTNDTGPLADHTNGKDGHYVYFEANTTSVTNGSMLASGVINEASKSCLSFWYMMYGDDIGSLTVFLASAENSTAGRKDLWQRSTPTDRQWHYIEVDVDIQAPSKIYFEATYGEGGGTKGNTAVDDFGLRSQPCGPTPLPESPVDCNFDKSFCGYKHLYPVSYEHPVWERLSGPTPTADTGPTEDYPAGYSGHYVYPGSAQLHNLNGASSSLESPPLNWSPQRICLRFAYHMQGAETGMLVVIKKEVASQKLDILWTARGDQGEGWKLAEIDNDFTAPAFFPFIGVSFVTENLTVYSNVGLDNVQVTSGTCKPVAWTEGMDFRCDRPTTPCVRAQGNCNSTSQSCDCEEGFHGLQCQFSAGAQCNNSPCKRGICLNETVCVCPDQYYGDKCQHKMVQAECTLTKMVVNILPHGFTALASWNIRHPDTAGTSCKLKPAETVAAVSNRGLEGFVGEFLHENDPCAGNATLEEETVDTKTFSRQLYVYYDSLGRHPTDSSVTVNCTVNVPKPPPLPEPRLSVTVKEVRPLSPPQLTPGGRIRTDLEIRFALTIPNKEDMTEINVMQCTANNGVQTIYVVKRGCALYPVGELLYDGRDMGTEYFIMQVYKLPKASLTVSFKCSVRLCDSRVDFFCYQRALCFGRTKRSVSWEMEETMKGKNILDVEYSHTLTDRGQPAAVQ